MKTRSVSGWKTRMQVLALAALCGVAAITALPAFAQDPAATAPAATEAVTPVPEAPLVSPEATTAETTSAPVEAIAIEAIAPVEAAPAEAAPAEAAPAPTISKADTVWVLVSAALVIFMTLPGLALFYGAWCVRRTCCRS